MNCRSTRADRAWVACAEPSALPAAISVRRLRSNQLDATSRYATIVISAILENKRRDVGGQCRSIIWGLCDYSLHRTMLTENPACPSFGHVNSTVICSTQAQRQGLRNFPSRPPPGSSCPASDRKLHAANEHSRPPTLSSASVVVDHTARGFCPL